MAQCFSVHPTHPQARLIRQAAEVVRTGGVVAYPTDSSYALGCHLEDKAALERIRRLRRLGEDHHFTLVCRDLSELGRYARVTDADYRFLKAHTPGPYTFILAATREVPKRLQHPKRKTIGLRVPDSVIVRALLAELGEPIMSVSMIPPGEEQPLGDPGEIRSRFQHDIDLVIDGGIQGGLPTTVLSLDHGAVEILRQGRGEVR